MILDPKFFKHYFSYNLNYHLDMTKDNISNYEKLYKLMSSIVEMILLPYVLCYSWYEGGQEYEFIGSYFHKS